MSIASELQTLAENKEAIRAAIQEMSGTDPAADMSKWADAIKNISFSLTVSATTIPSGIFNGSKIASIAGNNVTSLEKGAFASCKQLTDVYFHKVTTSGLNTFRFCTKLETVSFPALTSIGGSAFRNCSALKSVSIPSIETIEDSYAFASNALTDVSITNKTAAQIRAMANFPFGAPTTCVFHGSDGNVRHDGSAWVVESNMAQPTPEEGDVL